MSDVKLIISTDNKPASIDFRAGALLLIDKPKDWTSFDVVNKIRYKIRHRLELKKFKVGHAGTLDPDLIEAALAEYRGDIMQAPPMFSAVKVNGTRLYNRQV